MPYCYFCFIIYLSGCFTFFPQDSCDSMELIFKQVFLVFNMYVSPLIFFHLVCNSCTALSDGKEKCTHPGVIGGMCIICGQKMDEESGVAYGYIHKVTCYNFF